MWWNNFKMKPTTFNFSYACKRLIWPWHFPVSHRLKSMLICFLRIWVDHVQLLTLLLLQQRRDAFNNQTTTHTFCHFCTPVFRPRDWPLMTAQSAAHELLSVWAFQWKWWVSPLYKWRLTCRIHHVENLDTCHKTWRYRHTLPSDVTFKKNYPCIKKYSESALDPQFERDTKWRH